jgi:ATP-dependent DNA ligase
MGLEGIVSKGIGSRYVSGRAWLKTKNANFERR